jgi:nicotinamidase-related amidase
VLLLIDMQRDYIEPNGRMPVAQDQVGPMITATNAMIEAMQQHAFPIIYTVNQFNPFEALGDFERNFAAMRYKPGSMIDLRINPLAGFYFAKGNPSAFTNPVFNQNLEFIGAGRLVLAGTYVERSVLRTAQDAIKRGYSVTVISDAVAGANAQERDTALQKLKEAGAQIETSHEFIESLGTAQTARAARGRLAAAGVKAGNIRRPFV